MLLRGEERHAKLAAVVGCHTNTIKGDLKWIRETLAKELIDDMRILRSVELRKLQLIESEAFEAWEKSKAPQVSELVEKQGAATGAEDQKVKMSKTTEHQVGDPRFLAILIQCRQRTAQLCALDAPPQALISGPAVAVEGSARFVFVLPDNGRTARPVTMSDTVLLPADTGGNGKGNGKSGNGHE